MSQSKQEKSTQADQDCTPEDQDCTPKDQHCTSEDQDEHSQEIFIILRDGKIVYLPYGDYHNDATKISWWDNENNYHFSLNTPNGYPPANLVGPIMTKVIQWNVDYATLPNNLKNEKPGLETGYLIDLRGLSMSPLLNPTSTSTNSNQTTSPKGDLDDQGTPQNNTQSTCKQFDGYVPKNCLSQLQETPDENLYIISWQDPISAHSQNETAPYQMNYISKEELSKKGQLVTINGSLSLQNENKYIPTSLIEYLKDYYEMAGVQCGSINPNDAKQLFGIDPETLEPAIAAVTCYVANLKSFSR